MRPLLLALALAATAQAQWEILPTPTAADLRGIHAVSPEIAWASGTNGTVLRTTDAGAHWTLCPVAPGAEKLDFRGIQAFDAQTAIVMSSGKGDLSRLYKTTDACATWTLLFTNPDPEGFWNAIYVRSKSDSGIVIGDPVQGRFALFRSQNNLLDSWTAFTQLERAPYLKFPSPHYQSESLFAASNSVMQADFSSGLRFVTGGADGAFFYSTKWHLHALFDYATASFLVKRLPLAKGDGAGAFSFASDHDCALMPICKLAVVGGDYKRPDEPAGTAALSADDGQTWHAAQTPPHGYRSSVAYSPETKTWITVGPNGTDISTDDGRNWRALKPIPADAPDADRNWNALSLPYVVGPHGRIGKLRPTALTHGH